ncbi:Venom dipeptidyl peptidase 4, partial [Blattella germanica]
IFRHSFLANYDIIYLETRESIPLENGEKGPENRVHQLVVWAPTGNGFVYVHRNNIYYRPTAGNIAEVQLTRNGIPGIIYHGIPDWPGTPNPTAGLSVINLEQALIEKNFNTYKLETPRSLIASGRDLNEPILSAVTWSSDNDVVAVWMNRIQNEARIQSCDGVAAKCTMLYSISEANGWVDLFNPPLFSQDGSRMLLIHPHEEGESGPYRHVTMIQEGKITAITSGKFTVTDIVAWDKIGFHIILIILTISPLGYFLATEEQDPAVRHLYKVFDNPDTAPNDPQCLSCSVKTVRGNTDCLYASATFSTNNSYYTLTCAGPGVPEISLFNRQNERQMVLETNEDVRQMLEGKTLPTTKRLEVDVPGGFKAQVQLFLPPNLDTSGKTKYPLLVNVQLGNPEIEDQVNVTRYLQKNLNYIDSSRTAIWGWSYGGYATGMALAKDKKDVFKCGISVAPVSDWIYYDTIYTERYMGLPILEDNLKGYEDSALTKIAKHINGKQYLLIHGTLDDNVHYQQSMMLARKLEREDVLFQQMVSKIMPHLNYGYCGIKMYSYAIVK